MRYTYDSFLKDLGARLKQMRKDRGWTLRMMVVEHKFHVTHWQGFENGKAISVRSLLRVCEVFDVSLEDLVRGLGCSAPSEAQSDHEAPEAMPAAAKSTGRIKQSKASKKQA